MEQNFKLLIIYILTDLIENENKLNKTIVLYNTQINLDYMDLKKINKFIKNDIKKYFNQYISGNFKIEDFKVKINSNNVKINL